MDQRVVKVSNYPQKDLLGRLTMGVDHHNPVSGLLEATKVGGLMDKIDRWKLPRCHHQPLVLMSTANHLQLSLKSSYKHSGRYCWVMSTLK
jgi:hypothetical protein